MDSLLNKLEEIKQLGAYGMCLMFGEDVGCDDSDVPTLDRRTQLMFTPVGCLGEVRMLWVGRMKDFLMFNFKTKPKVISNPPKPEEWKDDGYYIWGTDSGVEYILRTPFFGEWI